MAETHRIVGDNAWVDFKAEGYPFSLRKKLNDTREDEKAIELILPYITGCWLPVIGSADPVTLPHSLSDLDGVDEGVVVNVIRQFYAFRNERLREPLPKAP